MANRIRSILGLATAATAENISDGDITDSVEASLLEQSIAEDRASNPAAFAAEQLTEFRLTPGAKSLLERSMDNLSKNNGTNIEDPDLKVQVQIRSGLIEAADNDLSIVLEALSTSAAPKEVPGMVYSMLYNVLKGAVFVANNDYRRYLDPRADFDITTYTGVSGRNETGKDRRDDDGTSFAADQREEHSPLEGLTGHPTSLDYQMDALHQLYGRFCESEDDVIPCALEDLRLFFQLTAESFGWDPTSVMPFSNVLETNGTYTPINDPMQALDAQQIKNQQSRALRRDKQNGMLAAAQEKARALARAALQR